MDTSHFEQKALMRLHCIEYDRGGLLERLPLCAAATGVQEPEGHVAVYTGMAQQLESRLQC